ncbi:MAG: right-handed parallel beta-helix repeat-containing protein [Thermoanaerobaculales bacterium]|jgi:parallel beta-helix repeat protein|nr:right-handed parallel beta-helix repeat-containing protein [Thermoanaerobaculales bacterium]
MPGARAHVVVLLTAAVLGSAATAQARDWYVAPDGVDGGPGTIIEPLATLAHAVGRTSSGDSILLERGGTYRAFDLGVGAGRTITAYGSGARPVLTGSARVELFGVWGGNPAVRTGAVAERVVECYVDGRFVRLARWPNADAGFLRNDADDQPDQIVDAELATRPGVAPGRWTGARVRWRRWSWWWETRPVTSHAPVNTLTLGPEGRFSDPFSDPGSGYFIDNDLDELDAPGEWFWQAGTLYLYPPTWADPATMTVDVVTTTSTAVLPDHDDEPEGIRSAGATFTHLHFSRYYGTALQLNGPSTVADCTFSELGSNAVHYTWNAQPFAVRRSVFRDVRNIAIRGWADAGGPAGSVIERNLFLRIGVEPGYGGWGSWHAAGIIVGQANAAVVRLNRFVDTGYAGIILGSDGQTVERNVFVRTMRTLNDGAAVYTSCNASQIRDNIILDTIGDLEYSHPWWPMGHGIWPEFLADFHDTVITGNTLYGNNGHGIFLPNNFDCTIADNVVVDSRRAALGLYVDAIPDQGHSITGNTLASNRPSRRIVRPENLSHWWLPPYTEPDPVALEYDAAGDYGLMSHTTFVAPTSVAGVIRSEPSGTLYSTLAAWTAAAPWASATGSLISRTNAILLFNDTEAQATMTVPAGSWTFPNGAAPGASVSLAPFASVVLVTTGTAPTSPPYHAASGIYWRAATPVPTYLGDAGFIFADGFEPSHTGAWVVP